MAAANTAAVTKCGIASSAAAAASMKTMAAASRALSGASSPATLLSTELMLCGLAAASSAAADGAAGPASMCHHCCHAHTGPRRRCCCCACCWSSCCWGTGWLALLLLLLARVGSRRRRRAAVDGSAPPSRCWLAGAADRLAGTCRCCRRAPSLPLAPRPGSERLSARSAISCRWLGCPHGIAIQKLGRRSPDGLAGCRRGWPISRRSAASKQLASSPHTSGFPPGWLRFSLWRPLWSACHMPRRRR